MALAATHIRFALDIREKLEALDSCDYVVGSLYPDSRLLTRVPREVTHPKDFQRGDFMVDDFHKGWYSHLVCDDIQYRLIADFIDFEDVPDGSNASWISLTAIKVLQDIADAKAFDLKGYLRCIENAYAPNGENSNEIQQFNQIFLQMYEHINSQGIDAYRSLWEDCGLGPTLGRHVLEQTKAFQSDESIMARCEALYQTILKEALENI